MGNRRCASATSKPGARPWVENQAGSGLHGDRPDIDREVDQVGTAGTVDFRVCRIHTCAPHTETRSQPGPAACCSA
jgi:hypothetical protein